MWEVVLIKQILNLLGSIMHKFFLVILPYIARVLLQFTNMSVEDEDSLFI